MKKTQFYASLVCLVIAGALAFLNLNKIETSFGDTSLVNVKIFPTGFFLLLGVLLLYLGLAPLLQKSK